MRRFKIEKEGLMNTYSGEARGSITWFDDSGNMHRTKTGVVIRVTSEDSETLSLQVDEAQITVDYEDVVRVVEEARKHNLRLN